MQDNMKWFGFGLVIVLLIAVFEQQRRKQAKVRESLSDTSQNIATGNVQGTIGGAVSNVPRDTVYNPAFDAEAIWQTGCYLVWGVCYGGGNQEKFASVITRLNKSQLATLYDYFRSKYGMSIDAFIANYFYESERKVIQQAIASVKA